MGSWRVFAEESIPTQYFLDIADDGYVITGDVDLPDEAQTALRARVRAGLWPSSPVINRLDECVDEKCACSRARNPHARRLFLESTCQRLAEVARGREEVSYASLGCGLLRFDFTLLEMLLVAKVPVTAVHLVDTAYAPDAEKPHAHRAALAQFAAWFAGRVDVYAHATFENFGFRVRSAQALPVAVLQVDCWELTSVWELEVKPLLEEVLLYGGIFVSLTARGSTSGDGSLACPDAWGEVWRLVPETGRMKQVCKTRYKPGDEVGLDLAEDEVLPPAVGH